MKTSRKPTQLRQVAIAQLRFLYKEKYLAGLIGVVVLEMLVMRILAAPIYYEVSGMPPWELRPMLAGATIGLLFIAVIAAFFTWFNEPPSRRGYHHSFPVDHRVHDSMRVFAGFIWLIVTLIVFSVFGALVEDRVMFEQWLIHAPTVWIGFFAVPLLVYLLCSIFVVAFERMIVWIPNIIFVALVMNSDFVAALLPEARDAAGAIVWDAGAPYSLAHVLSGANRSAPWVGTQDTERVFAATIDEYKKAHPEYVQPMQTREQRAASIEEARAFFRVTSLQVVPASPAPWLKALGVWWLIAIGGLVLAVRKKPAG